MAYNTIQASQVLSRWHSRIKKRTISRLHHVAVHYFLYIIIDLCSVVHVRINKRTTT
jgi:hypothetical protein